MNYIELKQIFKEKREELQEKINKKDSLDEKEEKFTKVEDYIHKVKPTLYFDNSKGPVIVLKISRVNPNFKYGSNKEYYNKLLSLRGYFPICNRVFDYIETISQFDYAITKDGIDSVDGLSFINILRLCKFVLQEPSSELIDLLATISDEYIDAKFSNNKSLVKSYDIAIRMILSDICKRIADRLLFVFNALISSERNKLPKVDKNMLSKEKEKNQAMIRLINKYDCKFSEKGLKVRLNEGEESELCTLLKLLIEDETKRKMIATSIIEGNAGDSIDANTSLESIKLNSFSDDERQIINEFREIIADEEFNNIFKIIKPKILFRFPNSNNRIDVEWGIFHPDILLTGAYKNEAINLFGVVVNTYREYQLAKVNANRVDKLNQIILDFTTIINFISRNISHGLDPELANNRHEVLMYLDEVRNYYLPIAQDMLESKDSNFDFEEEFDKLFKRCTDLIRQCKSIMKTYYSGHKSTNDNLQKENTTNLVFLCPNCEIDNDNEGKIKEIVGTVRSLEIRTSQELKCPSGRKGMTRIWKTTNNGTEIDFVKYIARNNNIKIHFVPYVFSSTADYRTGLLKFSPSTAVKKHLEERYGLSSQCAIYGIISSIEVIGANRSEYSVLEGIITKQGATYENLALLFADENPDFEKLDNMVDEMLENKRDFLATATKKTSETK